MLLRIFLLRQMKMKMRTKTRYHNGASAKGKVNIFTFIKLDVAELVCLVSS